MYSLKNLKIMFTCVNILQDYPGLHLQNYNFRILLMHRVFCHEPLLAQLNFATLKNFSVIHLIVSCPFLLSH